MNKSPRALNRVLLALIGLIALLVGLHLMLVCLVGPYASASATVLANVNTWVQAQLEATRTPGRDASWLWLVAAVLAAIVMILLIVWALVQGRGRVTHFSREAIREGDGRGVVEVASSVPEGLLKDALAHRPDVLRVSVSAWDQPGEAAGLRIRIQPRSGADPQRIVDDTDALVQSLDERLGARGPVVVELVGGARARFSTAERVR